MPNQRKSIPIATSSNFGSLVLIGLCALVLDLWTNDAGAQQFTQRNNTAALRTSSPKGAPVIQSTNLNSAVGRARAQQVRPRDITPVVLGLPLLKTDPNSPLGTALASCGKASDHSEPFSLPGGKGDVKLDRCYRGRAQHICANNVLLKEGRSLLQDYRKIIEARYPDLSNVSAVCAVNPDILSTDVQKAAEFTDRFKVLSSEYATRSNCSSRISQSLREIVLPDMAQAPEIIKSMVESLEDDSKDLLAVQGQVVDVAGKIDVSQKAMITIGKIHQTMCVKEQRAEAVSTDTRK
jgi:hypothetical protein